jgi:hypothetical protein
MSKKIEDKTLGGTEPFPKVLTKKINNLQIKPIKLGGKEQDKRPIKGEEMFAEIYANIFCVAKKNSGKTTVVYNIVKECCTRDTTVLVFASTVDKDETHLCIKQYCKDHSIPYLAYISMKQHDEVKVDIIDTLIDKLQAEAKEEEQSDTDDEEETSSSKNEIELFDSDAEDEEEKAPKRRKNKYRAPEYMIILDDISNELKSATLVKLLKMNRHFKMKVIVSSQYVNDLLPESIKQMDYCLIFKGEPLIKLQKLYKDLDLGIDFETFRQYYKIATNEKYGFLYIDARKQLFRKNFNQAF